MKSSPFPKHPLKLLVLLSVLSGCALADLSPPQGYPAYRSNDEGFIPIQPQSLFDFPQEQIGPDFQP